MARTTRFVFGPFVLEADALELRKRGQLVPIGRQTLLVLHCLVRARGEVVGQAALLAAGWSDVAVGDSSLRQAIVELRRVLGDETGVRTPIQTVRGEGYRFLAPVEECLQLRASPPVVPAHGAHALVGRDAELARLEGALHDAVAGHGKTVLLSGVAGVGKTRLGQALIDAARGRPVLALCTRAESERGAPPLWPWTRLVAQYLADLDDGPRARFAEAAPNVAGLLRPSAAGAPLVATLDTPDQQRFLLLEELASLFVKMAERAPLLLMFDDLHAADELSQRFFARLARETPATRLLLIATCRPLEGREHRPLTRMLQALDHHSAPERITLASFTVEETMRLCTQQSLRGVTLAAVAEVHALTRGNALFSLELLRLLSHAPAAGLSLSRARVQGTLEVRAVVQRRLACLSAKAQGALASASVIGEEFTVAELCGVTGAEPDEVVEALREACEAALLDARSPGLGYRFAHPLLREAAYHEMLLDERRRVHERVAAWIEARGPAVVTARVHELAHHYFCAASGALSSRAAHYLAEAGERAYEATAFTASVASFERALQVLAWLPEPDPERELRLKLRLAEALRATGAGRERLQPMFVAISEQAAALGHHELFARAALGYAGQSPERFALARTPNEVDPTERALLRKALALLGDEHPPLRALLLTALSFSLLYALDADARHDAIAEACTIARAHSDPAILARVLSVRVLVEAAPGREREQEAACDELVELAARYRLSRALVDGLILRALFAFSRGDGARSRADFRHANRVADELGCPEAKNRAALHGFFTCFLEGRLNDIEPHMRALFAGERDPVRGRLLLTLRMLGVQYLRHGETARQVGMEPILEGSFAESPSLRCIMALNYAARGMHEVAAREFDLAAADDFAALPASPTWMVELSMLGLTACALFDRQRAARIYRRLVPYADRVILYAWEAMPGGPVAGLLGMLATVIGDLTEASRWFEQGIALCRKLEAPLYEQMTKSEYLRMLAIRGTAADLREMRVLARQLAAFGRLHGIGLFEARAAEAEAKLAQHVAARGPVRASS